MYCLLVPYCAHAVRTGPIHGVTEQLQMSFPLLHQYNNKARTEPIVATARGRNVEHQGETRFQYCRDDHIIRAPLDEVHGYIHTQDTYRHLLYYEVIR